MKNRFNNITSKEWLPFQKSWFIHDTDVDFYTKNCRFFVKYDDDEFAPNIFFYGNKEKKKLIKKVAKKEKAILFFEENIENIGDLQYILIDVRDELMINSSISNYKEIKDRIVRLIKVLSPKLKERRFISVILPNIYKDGIYLPYAWDLSYQLATGLTLKDEKIACVKTAKKQLFSNEIFYMLNFRKDENSTGVFEPFETHFFDETNFKTKKKSTYFNKRWEIIKPPRRNKKEVLHPAKYPENLIQQFIETFTKEGENVFDPMSGTASTQLAALQIGRNGYGTELSAFFSDIANYRLKEYLTPAQQSLDLFAVEKKDVVFKILNKDIREIQKKDFPQIDYIITSPPYWDMLNMKGAETQAKRKQKGLKLNYSDDVNDFGNIADYNQFINELCEMYFHLIKFLKPGGVLTIIVKNIKKKGKNYPFAYDLARILQKKLILLPEFFWLQDDINLAPYGYGNTFVSNTFHQYCLNFKKPIK